MSDLELLNLVIADMRQHLAIAPAVPAALPMDSQSSPLPQCPVTVIQDPALRFFAEQLKPANPISPIHPISPTSPPIDV